MGRKATARWKVRRAEFESEIALAQAAAITMQRIYRGRLGRILAEEKRIELAEFIAQIRAEEALDEEVSSIVYHVMRIFCMPNIYIRPNLG